MVETTTSYPRSTSNETSGTQLFIRPTQQYFDKCLCWVPGVNRVPDTKRTWTKPSYSKGFVYGPRCPRQSSAVTSFLPSLFPSSPRKTTQLESSTPDSSTSFLGPLHPPRAPLPKVRLPWVPQTPSSTNSCRFSNLPNND